MSAVMEPSGLAARLRAADPGRYVVYIAFLLILAVFAVVLRHDGFLTADNLLNVVAQTTPVTVMAVGLVWVLAAGEIDLSIGATVALSALVCALLLRHAPAPLAVAGGLASGAAVGLVNGLFVTRLRLPSFLVTLATMGIVAGLARSISDLQSVAIDHAAFSAFFGGGSVGPLPSLLLWSVGVVALAHGLLRETRFGAHVLAIGDNPAACRASGIGVDGRRLAVLVLSGLCAALAGLLYSGRLQAARYTLGEAELMTVIAAAIIGGTRLNGGVASMVGALVGSWIMGLLNNGLILMGLSVSEQMVVRGAIVLLAVSLTLREKRS